MGKSHKKGMGRGPQSKARPRDGPIEWTPKMTMNMSDLSRDDDFLNHLLVEKLGTGNVPLYVHKMDPTRALPKTDPKDLMAIVQRLIVAKGPLSKAIKQAVDELLKLHAVITFIKKFTQVQVDAFATHASRYFELYLPSGSIEIAHTSRYTHRTGKSELCILATRFMGVGTVITELKGSMAKLTREDEKEMKRNTDIRRDFSVIHSGQMKKNHLFLGPARFVNHDCENNCELFREGKYITFRVLRPIAIGEEITAHYGDGYFGRRNRHCLCATCERIGRGGYALQQPDPADLSGSDSDISSDSDTSSSDSEAEDVKPQIPLNVNERRTRRGVYHVQEILDNEDDSDVEDKGTERATETEHTKVADEIIPKLEEVEQALSSELSMVPSSSSISPAGPSRGVGLMTPDTDAEPSPTIVESTFVGSVAASENLQSTPYKSIISTRRQKATVGGESVSVTKSTTLTTKKVKIETIEKNLLVTPPPSIETASVDEDAEIQIIEKRVTRSASSAKLAADKVRGKASASPLKGKGKAKQVYTVEDDDEDKEPEVTRVLRARPSLAAHLSFIGSPAKQEIPRDELGRPLPTCSTCFNILPIIHVDKEVVWGVGKKKEMVDCPRCMRHFAIYSHPWPARTAGQRARFMPTPREELTPVDSTPRKVSSKVLPALDKKLAAAVKNPLKSRRRDSSIEEPPTKKRKTESGAQVTMSAKAKEALPSSGRTSSGRQNLPSTRYKEGSVKRSVGRPRSKTPQPRSYAAKKSLDATSINESISAPVDTGRFFTRNQQPPKQGMRSNKAISSDGQPRDGHGRFGIKSETGGKYQRKNLKKGGTSRAERALERDKIRSLMEAEIADSDGESDADGRDGEVEIPLRSLNGRERKRRKESVVRRESPKKSRIEVDEISDEPPSSFYGTPQSMVKRIGSLAYQRPNPISFARRSWLPRLHIESEATSVLDEPLGDATEKRVTIEDEPADSQDWRSTFAQSGVVEVSEPALVPVSPIGALTTKPSPVSFARRRWSADLWTSNTPHSHPSNCSDSSDDEDSGDELDNDDSYTSVDVNIDYSKRFSAFFIRPRQEAAIDNLSSDEEDLFIAEVSDKYVLQRKASFRKDEGQSCLAADRINDHERVAKDVITVSDK